MQLNDIFSQENYKEAVEFANKNGYIITEIEPDENGRRFQIQSFILTKEEVLDLLRTRREEECFPIINRGSLWFEQLTEAQKAELKTWYKSWLDITDKYVDGMDYLSLIPTKPNWLTTNRNLE